MPTTFWMSSIIYFSAKKMENQKNIKKLVKSFFSNSNSIVVRRKITRKIRNISRNLELINEEASSFGLQMRLGDSIVGSEIARDLETDSFSMDSIVFGRENDVSRIVEMLTINSTENMFCILPLVGMGGLGKTTLAREVFHDQRIKSHYENRIWVYVSEKFDAMIIFKNILASLTYENIELGSREVLLKKLQKDLGSKRYLLVLDNVWNEETEKWDEFILFLSGITSMRRNGVIVTTRSGKVASIVKTLPTHELRSLSEDNCWSIIKDRAFRGVHISSEFETMGKNIAKKCQGLPLAAKVVGGLLCGKSKVKWLSIEKNWLSDFGGDRNVIPKILKVSFDHLSLPFIKKCFAYCSVFPKGCEIEKDDLVELWMAEGFLQTDQKHDTETVGNNVFNLLVRNSLLQVAERDTYDNITHCKMHDLVHDLASSVLGLKENDNGMNDISQVRYIGYKFDGAESWPILKEQARCLRTLFYEGKISDIIFSNFKCLHVLVLIGEDVKELPSTIRELIHLRYLDVSFTRIECLPDSIGELYHLQTLRVVTEHGSENHLGKLPNTLKYMISLRHLHIPNIELPPEMGRLTSLQTLSYFPVSHENGRRIIELGHLKSLKGKLEICNLEKLHDKEEANSAGLF